MIDCTIEFVYGIRIPRNNISYTENIDDYIDKLLNNVCLNKILTMRQGYTEKQSIISSIPMDVINVISKRLHDTCLNDLESIVEIFNNDEYVYIASNYAFVNLSELETYNSRLIIADKQPSNDIIDIYNNYLATYHPQKYAIIDQSCELDRYKSSCFMMSLYTRIHLHVQW